jgi:hydrogenase maturation protease
MPTKSGHDANRGEGLSRLLVVGCGNELAGDDSAGVEIVRRLKERGESTCQFRSMPCADVELLELFPSVDMILFVDAVASGAPAGTLHLVPLPSREAEPRAMASLSSHGWGLTEIVELAEALGRPIPRLMLLGVEAGSVNPGATRSVAVERAIEVVVQGFPRLRALLMKGGLAPWAQPQHFQPGNDAFAGE